MAGMRATVQLCTYNRSALLARVLEACFEQTTEDAYEVVLVNDGSTDDTRDVIDAMRPCATCPFVVVEQPNSGLAKARNAGIARARGERIIFIDDDVLVLPNFVAEHLRSGRAFPGRIVRGGAINVESFDDLPPPIWSIRNYSGNYFWTTNVSVPLETLKAAGAFDESFAEYGWEDIDVGLRLRARGVRATFNPRALVYHYKPKPKTSDVAAMERQARAQARTALRLGRLHPRWRARLATGDYAAAKLLHRLVLRTGVARRCRRVLQGSAGIRTLTNREVRAARRLATEAYFEELDQASRANSALSN
jgi:glycosyltransferase involved in cell wall biosynthesis